MQTVPGIAALVPRRLWSDDYGQEVRQCRGTILFADIAGFTRLTETAKRRAGTRGIELLTTQINAIFGDLVEAAHASGGDILKFGGDAILVAYDAHSPDSDTVSAAIAGACAMSRSMATHRRTTLRALSLHLGLAHGQWNEIVAGIPGRRREHFVWGNAISAAMAAADSGGTRPRIHCPLTLLTRSIGLSQLDRVGRGLFEFGTFRQEQDTALLTRAACTIAADRLWDFVAESLRNKAELAAFATEQSAEHRSVSTLFGFWTCQDVEGDPVRTAQLFDRIFQATYRIEQSHEGLWARSDPSGHKQKLLILFGSTRSRTDDADHALAAARALQAEFLSLKSDFPSIRLGIGAATATVFAGFVGHATRREFTAMGDGVNLAARLAAKSKRGMILVDGNTRADSSRFQFRSAGSLRLKNVRLPAAVYVPTAEIDAMSQAIRGDIVEHPFALSECVRRWEDGLLQTWLNVLPGANAGKFVAQLLSRIGIRDESRRMITFDSSDAMHPLGGTRRVCASLYAQMNNETAARQSDSLAEMFHENGQWATRTLRRLGLEAAATSVVREILHRPMPDCFVILDHLELLGEFDRRVISSLLARPGTHWLAIVHGADKIKPLSEGRSQVRLGAIGRTEMAMVIGDLLSPARPSKAMLDFLLERSQGLPRLACTFASHLIAQGAATRTKGRQPVWHTRSTENIDLPSGLRAQYLQHIDRLPPSDLQVLRGLAVLGDSVVIEPIKLLCGDFSEIQLTECLERLIGEGLVDSTAHGNDTQFAIEDPTCRQAVYETMSHQSREAWHRKAAVYWKSAPVRVTAQIGEHLFRARDPSSAQWLTQAARQSRRFWSLDRALRYSRWAILASQGRCDPEYAPLCPPISGRMTRSMEELYIGLADILQLQGRHAESGRVRQWLARSATHRGDRRLACRHQLSSARMDLLSGHYKKSRTQATHVLRISRQLRDTLIRANASYLIGETYRRSGRIDRALEALEVAESLASRGNDRSLHSDVLNALGLLHWNCGRLEQAKQSFEFALRRLPTRIDHARRGQVANNLGILTEEQGRLRVAERFYTKAFGLFDKTGVRRHRAYSLGNLANLHRHAARYERAREAYEEVETELRSMGEAHAAAYTVGNIGDLERDFGDSDSARHRYDATLEFARKSGDEELKAECYARIARLHLLAGRLELMPRALSSAQAAATRAESPEFSLYADLLMTECDLAKGNYKSASRRIESTETKARAVGLVYYQLWTEYLLARTDLALGNVKSASKRCLAGMARGHASGYRWWELRYAVLGASGRMRPKTRARCIESSTTLIREVAASIGDSAAHSRFLELSLVRTGLSQASDQAQSEVASRP